MPPPPERIYVEEIPAEPSPTEKTEALERREEIILLLEEFSLGRIEMDEVLQRLSRYGLRYIQDEKNEDLRVIPPESYWI
jgi:hypothetical protein